jgi:serine O-acetyltransferase
LKLSLDPEGLSQYVARQLSGHFPDRDVRPADLLPSLRLALERLEHCFSRIGIKYFCDQGQATFNHLNTDQYAMFLYFLSNSLHRSGGPAELAAKLYALNKALHALDLYYEVEMPDIFALQHPVGTVIGRARFSDYLFIYQRCSIGANLSNQYPVFGKGVVLFGGAAVIGNCTIGDNVWLSVGTTILEQDVPAGQTVFGRSPQLVMKKAKRDVVRDMFIRSGTGS